MKYFSYGLGAFLLFGMLMAALTWSVWAAPDTITIAVNTTADEFDTSGTGAGCSFREAVQTANTDTAFGGCTRSGLAGGTDTILLPGGTLLRNKVYRITRNGTDDTNATGDFDITAGVVISATGAVAPKLSGNASINERVLHLLGGAVTLQHIVVTDGLADGTENGGGILIDAGVTAVLNNSFVQDNRTAKFGGGIFNQGTLTLNNTIVQRNFTERGGGGIVNGDSGVLTLTHSRVLDNSANGVSSIGGGGISGSNVINLTDSEISGNTTIEKGGGILLGGGTLTLVNSLIANNQAARGAGLSINANSGSVSHVVNSTLSGNQASIEGGAIYLEANSTVNLYNATVTNNSSGTPTDGGGPGGILRAAGTVNLLNTLVAGNHSLHNSSAPDCLGTLTSLGNNLIGSNDGCTLTAQPGDKIGTNANPLDAKLAALADNGGVTKTHALLTGSPAIDAGNSSGCQDQNNTNLTTDQRGSTRPTDGDGLNGARCDIGAYEAAAGIVPTATPTLTPTPGPTPTSTPLPGCTTAPDMPVLTAPIHKATITSLRPKLNWTDVACAQTYRVVLYKNKVGGTVIQDANGLTLSELKTKRLTAGFTYAWQAQACNAHGCSALTTAHKFTVAP